MSFSDVARIAKENRGVSRKVQIGNFAYEDKIGGYFPNFSRPFRKRPMEKQVLNVEDFADGEVIDRKPDDWDAEMTQRIRGVVKRLSRQVNTACFFTGPILADEDKVAIVLPTKRGGNTSKFDALTFNQPEFDALMTMIATRAEKVCTTDSEFESLKNLFINYTIPYPRTVAICHDGRVKADPKEYPEEKMSFLGEAIWKYLSEAFHETSMCGKISMNVTKSPGFPKMWPDGSPLTSDQCYLNLDYAEAVRDKTLSRKNYTKYKIAWLDDGAMTRNLIELLTDPDHALTKDGLVEYFLRFFCNAACWGLRMNNGDVPLVSRWDEILKNPSAAGKHRPAVFELPNGLLRSLTLDTGKWASAFHQLNHTTKAPLKPRYMYPAPNATYAAPFNGLFKRLVGKYEDSAAGFPSMNVKVLARYLNNFKKHSDMEVSFLQFDRSNSEQFITDNFELILQLFPPAFQKILYFCGTSILPSDQGPRVVRGGLPSGSPTTTFLNMMMGLVENVMQILFVCNVTNPTDWFSYAQQIVDHIFTASDAILINGYYVLANLGTDDQIAVIWHDKPLGKPRTEGRSLGADIVKETTVFGLSFTSGGIEVAKSLNLDKFHLQEHLKCGDAMAYKMKMRLDTMDPKFKEVIASSIYDSGYGDITDYENGKVAYDTVLAEYGYIPDPLANSYSPTDRVVFKQALILEEGNNVPDQYCIEWDDAFNQYFKTHNL